MSPRPPVHKLLLGPLGWGVVSLVCNVCLLPGVLAWICALTTLTNLPDGPSRASAQRQSLVGMVLAGVQPMILMLGLIALGSLPQDRVDELVEEFLDAAIDPAPPAIEPVSAWEPTPEPVPAESPGQNVVLPTSAEPGDELPVAVWLHGWGGGRSMLYGAWAQRVADSRGIALVGVDGPLQDPEDGGYVWSMDPTVDIARVHDALTKLRGSVSPEAGHTVLFGFSQGGELAGALAALDPTRFAGAVVLSPGGDHIALPPPALAHRSQGFAVAVGADEHPGNVEQSRRHVDAATARGSRVLPRFTPGQSDHAFPEGWQQFLPQWFEFCLKGRRPLPELRPYDDLVHAEAAAQLLQFTARGFGPTDSFVDWTLEWIEAEERHRPALHVLATGALEQRRALEATWTEPTDNDRLDAAFAALTAAGWVARQDFEDCSTCASSSAWAELEALRDAGKPAAGYVFFHQQDTDGAVDGGGVFLSYGTLAEESGGAEATAAAGRSVVTALKKAGLKPAWDGDSSKRIDVPMQWRKRLLTEAP